jgi:hypothetical protein
MMAAAGGKPKQEDKKREKSPFASHLMLRKAREII